MLFCICAILYNFYPRPPRGGRRNRSTTRRPARRFLSTPSARRATFVRKISAGVYSISIHALREEGDGGTSDGVERVTLFLSTPSARRATGAVLQAVQHRANFYPRPPRGGRPTSGPEPGRSGTISIHALREEGDGGVECPDDGVFLFLSTPSARRATDTETGEIFKGGVFLSTPSARRATTTGWYAWQSLTNFYPRPPRGGRHGRKVIEYAHACYFYPRPPRGGRRITTVGANRNANFYPRPPRGGRQRRIIVDVPPAQFLSTPSARRATWKTGLAR